MAKRQKGKKGKKLIVISFQLMAQSKRKKRGYGSLLMRLGHYAKRMEKASKRAHQLIGR
jgi:hypothetical protein